MSLFSGARHEHPIRPSAVRQIVGRIYAGENRGQCPPEALDRIFARALVKGAVSYRRVVQAVADELQ